MHSAIAEDKNFESIDTGAFTTMAYGTYENCVFKNCDLSGARFDEVTFIDCRFEGCNLQGVSLFKTGLQNILYKDCQVQGVDLSRALDFLFAVNMHTCNATGVNCYKKKNKAARFTDCNLSEADFTEAELSDAVFENCNFNRAQFSFTNLKGADLRTSYNFIINPDENTLKKTRISVQGLPGLLTKYDLRIEG